MIAGYIKFFTRWINSWVYGIALFFATCMKAMVMFFIQYSVGIFMSLVDYGEQAHLIIGYLESVHEMTIAGIIIHLVVFMFLFWYFLNSSIDPVVRIKDYSNDQCQLENLEIQLNELKEKSIKESKEIADIQKNYEEEIKKSKKYSSENADLKEKVSENDADKKQIEDLQQTVKKREEAIEIKACEIDRLQITLEATKDDITKCKDEYKVLEVKFFDAIKQLDTKDCTISDYEDGEKKFKALLNDKDQEIIELEGLAKHLNEQIKKLEDSISQLEVSLEEEKKISQTVRLEKEVLDETLQKINQISEIDSETQTDNEDSVKVAEQLKADRLAMLTDATKIKTELTETKTELILCKDELTKYKERNVDLEDKYKVLNEKFDKLCSKTDELKSTISRKDIEIATISKFFSERENEMQSLTTSQAEEIKKLTNQLSSIGEDRRQIAELNKQIDDLKEEIASNEKQHKHQIASIEEENHANYLKMRTATRECEEHKREKEIYRKKLLDNDMQPIKNGSTNASLTNASLDVSDRSESPGSNNSMEQNGIDASRQPLPARPPLPFPPSMMFRGMSPFHPRPPMGTPPFNMPPRLPYSAPPHPYMPGMRPPPRPMNPSMSSPISTLGYQQSPAQTQPRHSVPPQVPFNGPEYVNTLVNNLATKDNVRTELIEKQNKTIS